MKDELLILLCKDVAEKVGISSLPEVLLLSLIQ